MADFDYLVAYGPEGLKDIKEGNALIADGVKQIQQLNQEIRKTGFDRINVKGLEDALRLTDNLSAKMGELARATRNTANAYAQTQQAASTQVRTIAEQTRAIQQNVQAHGSVQEAQKKVGEGGGLWKKLASSFNVWDMALNAGKALLEEYKDELMDMLMGTTETSRRLDEANRKIAGSFSEEGYALEALKARFEDSSSTMKDKQEVVDELNRRFEDQAGHISSISDAETFFKDKTPEMIEAFSLRAKAAAAFSVAAEEQANQIRLAAQDPLEELGTLDKITVGLSAVTMATLQGDLRNTVELYKYFGNMKGRANIDDKIEISKKVENEAIKSYKNNNNAANDIDEKIGVETGGGKKNTRKTKGTGSKKDVAELRSYNKELAQEHQRMYDIQAKAAKMSADDESRTLEQRMASFEEYNRNKFQAEATALSAEYDEVDGKLNDIAKIEKIAAGKRTAAQQELLQQREVLLEKQRRIEADYALKQQEANVELNEGLIKLRKEAGEKEHSALLKKQDDITRTNAKAAKDETAELAKQYREGKINKEDFEKGKLAIQTKYDLLALEQITLLLEAEAARQKAIGKDTAELDAQIAGFKEKIDEIKTSITEATQPEEGKGIWDDWEEKLQALQQLAGEIANLLSVMSDTRIAELEAEAELIDQNGQKEIDRINKAALTEEEKQKKIRAAEARTEIQRKQNEALQRREKQKQAVANKIAAIADITINTAVAISKALAVNTFMVALVAALGAAQLATVLATPLPKYAKGRRGGRAEMAIVGEEGTEAVRERSGRMWLTGDSAHLAFLPEGAEVIPHHELMRNANYYVMQDMLNGANNRQQEHVLKEFLKQNLASGKRIERSLSRMHHHTTINIDGSNNHYLIQKFNR